MPTLSLPSEKGKRDWKKLCRSQTFCIKDRQYSSSKILYSPNTTNMIWGRASKSRDITLFKWLIGTVNTLKELSSLFSVALDFWVTASALFEMPWKVSITYNKYNLKCCMFTCTLMLHIPNFISGSWDLIWKLTLNYQKKKIENDIRPSFHQCSQNFKNTS